MNVRRLFEIPLGVLFAAPAAYAIYGLARMLIGGPEPEGTGYLSTSAGDAALLLSGAALIAICIALAYRLPSVNPDKRKAWVMFLLFGSIVAFPIFWYLHIFRDPLPFVPASDS